MPQNLSARQWLVQNSYTDIATLIDTVMEGWKKKGSKTRRNWWDCTCWRERWSLSEN